MLYVTLFMSGVVMCYQMIELPNAMNPKLEFAERQNELFQVQTVGSPIRFQRSSGVFVVKTLETGKYEGDWEKWVTFCGKERVLASGSGYIFCLLVRFLYPISSPQVIQFKNSLQSF